MLYTILNETETKTERERGRESERADERVKEGRRKFSSIVTILDLIQNQKIGTITKRDE